MLAAFSCVLIFLWIMVFLFFPLLTPRPSPIALPPMIAEMVADRGFVLPPTWTPGPTPEFDPTGLPTVVDDGSQPTRIYTPRATSLPGLVLPGFPRPAPASSIAVLDLARIMQGESAGDKEAAYYVGWVAKNRLMHPSYGDTYAVVSHGFFGYKAEMQPREDFLELAKKVIRAREDPTDGSLFALSRTDITKLGVPPQRADVTEGEWFLLQNLAGWPPVILERGLLSFR